MSGNRFKHYGAQPPLFFGNGFHKSILEVAGLRGKRVKSRKSNLLIFLTPHVIDDSGDLEEIYRIKVAQRQEFIRRFYGKSRDEQEQQLSGLLSYSMNHIDQPSRYRGNVIQKSQWNVIGEETTKPSSEQPKEEVKEEVKEDEKEKATETTPSPDLEE